MKKFIKEFIDDVRQVVGYIWIDDNNPRTTFIGRAIVILAFMGLPLALVVLSALIYWVVF